MMPVRALVEGWSEPGGGRLDGSRGFGVDEG